MMFCEKLLNAIHTRNSLLCVGLDVDQDKIPAFLHHTEKDPYLSFNKAIIDATKDLVCAYKLNMAFYEILGKHAYRLLEATIKYIPRDVIVILDGKRNDIGNTAEKYASAIFDKFGADATTVNPFLGFDSVAPFLTYKDKCSFILCRTSNPSAGEFQDLIVGSQPLYQIIAQKIKQWNNHGTCGAVVGATYPEELKKIRAILGDDIPLLIPGIGRQGGDVEKTIVYGVNSKKTMAIINSSRDILYAAHDEHFSDAARTAAEHLRTSINNYR
ncbi:MAG: orotidine-5'-phosphate decarboxylase [Candidatus Thermoplasmatota archaeon]